MNSVNDEKKKVIDWLNADVWNCVESDDGKRCVEGVNMCGGKYLMHELSDENHWEVCGLTFSDDEMWEFITA